MPNTLTNEDIDRIARKRAGAKLGWYAHAVVYVVVNAFLFAISFEGITHRRVDGPGAIDSKPLPVMRRASFAAYAQAFARSP